MTVVGDILVVSMMKKINFLKKDYAKRHHSGYLEKKLKMKKFTFNCWTVRYRKMILMGLKIAKEVQSICMDSSIDYIFKASYKKQIDLKTSFTGIGNENALEIIRGIKRIKCRYYN